LTAQRTVPAEASQLAVLNQFLREFWTAAALAPARMGSFELALEEIFMNVVMHARQPGIAPHRVELSLSLDSGAVTMMVEDDGPQFNPLSLPPPDLTAPLADRNVGGLGVYLVRNVMDTVSYARIAGRNQLRMSKRLSG
jgi:anti-sigma regulatory factor (Ser/Thr protein kinase)